MIANSAVTVNNKQVSNGKIEDLLLIYTLF